MKSVVIVYQGFSACEGGGCLCVLLRSFYVGYGVEGQDEDPMYGSGGLALSPQDVELLGQQLVDMVGNRESQTTQSGISLVGVFFSVFVDFC